MSNNKPLTMALSQEELWVIQKYLGMEDMVGFDQDVFAQLDKKQLQLVVGVGERALLARGFLKAGAKNRLQLIPEVLAVTGTCADPDRTVIISRQEQKNPDFSCYFHNCRKMFVIHTIPMTAIHQFIAVESAHDWKKAAYSIVRFTDFQAKFKQEFSINRADFKRIKDFDENKGTDEQLITSLSLKENDKIPMRSFLKTMHTPQGNTTFFAHRKSDKETQVTGFTVVNDAEDWWSIEPGQVEGKADETYLVRNIDSKELKSRIESCFN